ncbi:RimK family alpha-L-glutamate ligase [Actinocrispum wychmicini]|uniref:[lysine-biosynthesis-protein LysW]--L-2-aminoadipate ligase n=1 Tax=Actinocrispum wychmicini TaxID=1213861 RepID=A0A4R2JN42_9PSEU|nr:RimK family alpha-L-glutamate ligase [Actinocrispum wychmicini]TCO55595.1 [lysine-biosynthesis-protein LysW]--L-2-aminoadipate ligase [Actinocrispum wychmicini]
MTRLIVLASRLRADELRIFETLERRGVRFTHVDPRRFWGFPDRTDNTGTLVLNREISFTRALYAARTLEAHGMAVVNTAAATELCGDKWRTTLALTEAGLPVPPTALALTPESALDALDEIGYPAVVKPLVGSWGRLVSAVPDRAVAETVLEYVAALPGPQSHVVYAQKMVAKPGRDIRVAVLGGEAVGAGYRRADHWRTNVSRGAATEYCELTAELSKLAVAAAGAVQADIAGVDVIEDTDGGLLILEVNHGLEFSGLQHALGDRVDVAGQLVDYLLARADG